MEKSGDTEGKKVALILLPEDITRFAGGYCEQDRSYSVHPVRNSGFAYCFCFASKAMCLGVLDSYCQAQKLKMIS